jgi:hypothetical protein
MTRRTIGTVAAFALLTSCHQRDPIEKPLAGQPSMNQLMHRHAESSRKDAEMQEALMRRARSLTAVEARQLIVKLRSSPQDDETYWTLVRHYEHKVNLRELHALRLWYIEHQPDGKIWPGNINPRYDKASYERGKALWLAHVKRLQNSGPAPKNSREIYRRAADFLEGGDKPLAEQVLRAGRQAFANDHQWMSALGRHYAQVLIGSTEPMTEYNVIRKVDAEEAATPYARKARQELAESNNAALLRSAGHYLMSFARLDENATDLARTYMDRADSIEGTSVAARQARYRVATLERSNKLRELSQLTPAQLSKASAAARALLFAVQMRNAWHQNKYDDSASKAREVLRLLPANAGDDAFEANMILGKIALRRGDRQQASRYLLAAADTQDSKLVEAGHFEMNLPRALVDAGSRTSVALFLEKIAPKTGRAKELQGWAASIRKGINPDLLPTFSSPGCSHDPC